MIRVAKINDVPKIFICGSRNLPIFHSKKVLTQVVKSPEYLVSIMETKKHYLMGFLIAQFKPNNVRVISLAIAKTHRRRGLATKLIKNLIQTIKEKNTIISLHVHTENQAAIKLYKNLGFVIQKLKKDFYLGLKSKTQDAYKMQLVFN